METDKRYTISHEYCGYSIPMYIVRFCDKTIGCCLYKSKAEDIIKTHQDDRDAILKRPHE